MDVKVSVIVPIYNVEKYLRRCLDSLVNQTLREIEIIAVNDGSRDNCLEILRKYAEMDRRIIVVNKANGGLGSARNAGLDIAHGEFVGFVDADDWVEADIYEKMYRHACLTRSDRVICDFIRDSGQNHVASRIHMDFERVYSRAYILGRILPVYFGVDARSNAPFRDQYNSVCNNLYRLKPIKEYEVRFLNEREYYFEDLLFNLSLIMHIEDFSGVDCCFYHYVCNGESLSNVYRSNMLEMKLKSYHYMMDFARSNRLDFDYRQLLYNRLALELPHICSNYSQSNVLSFKEKSAKIKEITVNETVRECLRQADKKLFASWKHRVLIFLLNHSTMTYAVILFLNFYHAVKTKGPEQNG